MVTGACWVANPVVGRGEGSLLAAFQVAESPDETTM